MQNLRQSILVQQPKLQGSSKQSPSQDLPQIPDKLYFTIGEVSTLCLLKPHVLRYWEQEFSQLSPAKRCGNRRYYQRSEILLIRRIKNLLYERGFTIEGAKAQLNGDNQEPISGVDIHTSRLIATVITQLTSILVELERK